jgi:hypothetical protein
LLEAQRNKIMTPIEAEEIFKVWKEWYWPCHFLLDSVFGPGIPESFLPYPKDVLEEALNIIAKRYYLYCVISFSFFNS